MASTRTRLALAALGTAAFIVACTQTTTSYIDEPIPEEEGKSDAGFDSRPDPNSSLGELGFLPEKSFSGFDGTHTFTVPVAVYDAADDDLEVTADDPSAVTITPKKLKNPTRPDGTHDNGKYYFITIEKAGTITLVAKSKGRTAKSTITAQSYGADLWTTGETRYKNGGSGDPACTNCHVNGDAIDHSPAALATATDEKIAVVITTGISTSGFPIKINGSPGHMWKVSDDEKAGLVAYLRGLEPRGYQ